MSLSVGLPNAAGVTIGGKSAATIRALSDAAQAEADKALGTKEDDGKVVKTGPVGLDKSTETPAAPSNQSVAVKTLLKRMQELQQQLREQQQQLAAAQAASYPTPEIKAAALMAIQGQIAQTNGALLEVSAALVKELSKGASTGSVVNTTA
ncbi:hypothetical protein ACQKP7_21835 [Pseudomonas frederiksbergensis]|uniref:Uncharacterized protein n=1 Tax=Pseudomonas frederiksbergensis TaxID=104087 RepID=A0A423JZP1_9PSED|nr:hypothetical protein [Pseudomonas frederiksbergensis]RON43471.1 hypothetical protein BK666_20570 [Pseudomonas frederiksbergensis]